MGGKVWSDAEERYFWRTAMSFSPKRVGIDRSKPEMSWPQLATRMQTAMGGEARRQYTETMMFEHYFQNIESQRVSPNAVLYVYEYNIKKGKDNAAHRGKSHCEPHSSPSPTAAVPAAPPNPTEVQKMETGLKEKRDELMSSGTSSFGSRGPGPQSLGGHRRLQSYHPYARVPVLASPSPVYTGGLSSTGPLVLPENTAVHDDASLEYDGDETLDYDEGEISEYGGGETSESDEGESPD